MLLEIYWTTNNIIKILFSYLLIDRSLFSNKRRAICFILATGLIFAITYQYSFLGESFLFVILFLLSLKKEVAIFKVLLNILFSFTIQAVATLSLWPLFRLVPPFEEGGFLPYIFVELAGYILIGLLSLINGKYLIPLILRKRQEKKVLVGLLILFLSVQFEGFRAYVTEYPWEIFLIIVIALFLFVILIYYSMQEISEKQALKFEVERQKIEKEYMTAYSNETKEQYEELRKFKHDYINILSSLDYYIKSRDIERLERYFDEAILPTQGYIQQADTYFQQLGNVESEEIKSIVAIKLMVAKEKGVTIELEVPEKIADVLSVDSVVLVRMLGIILDNSIEEVSALPGGKIQIGLLDMGESYLFIVRNSIGEMIEQLSTLRKEGYSTKGEGRGLGLSTLDKLNQKEPDLTLETMVTEEFFTQKLTIQKRGKIDAVGVYL